MWSRIYFQKYIAIFLKYFILVLVILCPVYAKNTSQFSKVPSPKIHNQRSVLIQQQPPNYARTQIFTYTHIRKQHFRSLHSKIVSYIIYIYILTCVFFNYIIIWLKGLFIIILLETYAKRVIKYIHFFLFYLFMLM